MVTLEEYLKLDDQNQRPSEYANGLMVPIQSESLEVIGDLLRLSDIYWDVEPVAYL